MNAETFAALDPVRIDRERARRGLHAFVRMAWAHVENSPFVDGWHIAAICKVLEAISAGKRRDTVLNVPPGTGKSLLTGVFWPAWDWIENPWRRFMFASFDSSLLNGQSTKLISLLQSEWYCARWGARLPVGRPNTSEIRTTSGGMKFNTSFGGRGTGRHCHIQVLDDPIKPRDAAGGAAVTGVMLEATWETINNTFASRAADPNTFARLMVMQRIHEDDPSARALARGWSHVRFPMLYEADDPDPLDARTVDGAVLSDRFGVEFLSDLQKDAEVWATQYQQRPSPPGGAIFREEWIDANSCTVAEAMAKVGHAVQSWDLAFKDAEASDFVAGHYWVCTWEHDASGRTRPHFWLRARVNRRLSFVATCAEILGKRHEWLASEILIEDKANGPACENTIGGLMPGLIRLVNPRGSKVGRAHAVAPEFANGQIHIPRDLPPDENGRPGYEVLRSTLSRFPRVRRDDEVDALTQAVLDLRGSSLFAAAMDASAAR